MEFRGQNWVEIDYIAPEILFKPKERKDKARKRSKGRMETADMPLAADLGAQRTIPSFPYANLGQDKYRTRKITWVDMYAEFNQCI